MSLLVLTKSFAFAPFHFSKFFIFIWFSVKVLVIPFCDSICFAKLSSLAFKSIGVIAAGCQPLDFAASFFSRITKPRASWLSLFLRKVVMDSRRV
jgi:hypothetical protein